MRYATFKRYNCGHYEDLDAEKLCNAVPVPYPCDSCKAARRARAEARRRLKEVTVFGRIFYVKLRIRAHVVER